jgi:hypothetical protein
VWEAKGNEKEKGLLWEMVVLAKYVSNFIPTLFLHEIYAHIGRYMLELYKDERSKAYEQYHQDKQGPGH